MTAGNARLYLHSFDSAFYLVCAVVFFARSVSVLMSDGSGWAILGYFAMAMAACGASIVHTIAAFEE